MYQIQLSEAALGDLNDFSRDEVVEIYTFLWSLSETPRPAGAQTIPLPEAADGIAYLYETLLYSVFYNIFEIAGVVKVVAIFRKISLN